MGRLLLGIDGGGTKTVARIAEAYDVSGGLCIVGSGVASGSNPYTVGWDAAVKAITSAAEWARHQAGVEDTVEIAVLSIAGCATEAARSRLASEVEAAGLAPHVRVIPDTAPLLAAAPDGRAAVGIIAGTGSAAVGKTVDGRYVQIGGWGYLIDDAGSGFAVGQATLRALCRNEDAGLPQDEKLLESVLHTLDAEVITDLKPSVYGASDRRSRIAAVAPITIAAAEEGQALASSICDEQAGALARLAVDCGRRIEVLGSPTDCFLTGGLLTGSPYFRRLTIAKLKHEWPEVRPQLGHDAASGCCQIAAREAVASP